MQELPYRSRGVEYFLLRPNQLLHAPSSVLVTGDSTNNSERRPFKELIPNLPSSIFRVILKILAWVFLVLPRLRRFSAVQHADEQVGEDRKTLGTDLRSQEQHMSPSLEENPLWQRLQHLETLVNELVKKPTKIPPEKEDMLRESLSRIKSIEYDLQKTKKVKYPSLMNFSNFDVQ